MDALSEGEISLKVHGQKRGTQSGETVLAAVFAQKLGALVRALKAADKIANGANNHDYTITGLKIGSAQCTLSEQSAPRFTPGMAGRSGVHLLGNCLSLVGEGNVEASRRYDACLRPLAALARGAGKVFSYAELQVENLPVIRIDNLLAEQVELIEAKALGIDVAVEGPEARSWFTGVALGSFDGTIKQVDLRGQLPQVKLVLTAGNKEIDCILRGQDVQRLRDTLDRRVRIEGRAFYDGKSGMPRRIEVTSITPVKRPGDISRWKGTFEPFQQELWEGDEE